MLIRYEDFIPEALLGNSRFLAPITFSMFELVRLKTKKKDSSQNALRIFELTLQDAVIS
jgi:hypothetical protein